MINVTVLGEQTDRIQTASETPLGLSHFTGGQGDHAITHPLLQCLGDLLVRIDAQGVVRETHCPDDFEFPVASEIVRGRTLTELLTNELARRAMEAVRKTLQSGRLHLVCFSYALPGRVREFEARLVPDGEGMVLGLIRDATDRRQFEREILEVSHRTQLRIGQDLHDGLGQHLTGITFLSKALENRLSSRGLPEAENAAEIARLVIQALAQTRNLARNLYPVELERSGLVQALDELAGSIESLYKVSCCVEGDGNVEIDDPMVVSHLFRLAQEAVNNAVKHGQARRIRLRLSCAADSGSLSISDDGVGFDVESQKRNGMGIRIMRYRAQKIGARLTIRSGDPRGTEVICSFPLGKELAVLAPPAW